MEFLFLAVFFSTANHLMFKLFSKFQVQLMVAIAANYAVCAGIGLISSGSTIPFHHLFEQPWFLLSVVQGILLFVSFYLIGQTTHHHGVAAAGLATRLSVALPTIAAFFLYADTAGTAKLTGITTALFALYLSCVSPGAVHSPTLPLRFRLLPVWLFIAFGTHSILIKLVQAKFLHAGLYHTYIMAAFFFALVTSTVTVLFQTITAKLMPSVRDLAAGTCLGLINYGAIYFLVRTLGIEGWQSSQIFPTISICVVIFSTLGSFLLFKEQPGSNMLAAVGIGVISIILVNL